MRIRDGCRGGREQFTWGSLKEQEFKDRECYLGQSTKIGMMGKFGRYYMHDWYARKRDSTEDITSEQAAVQAYEAELMQEALGLKPKNLMLAKKQFTEEEMKEFLKRDEQKNNDKKGHEVMGPQKKVVTNELGEQVTTSNEEMIAVAARDALVNGIGFASHRTDKLEAIKAKTFGTEGQLQGTKSLGDINVKLEDEAKSELDDAGGSSSSTAHVIKQENFANTIKEEHVGKCEAPSKKQSCRVAEDNQKGQLHKATKQEKKKAKKEKKQRKAEKKLRKAERKLRRLEKREHAIALSVKRQRSNSATSLSEGSSTS